MMLSNEPAMLIMASFKDEEVAEKAFFDLKMDKRGRLIVFKDAAIVNRDEEDKLHIKETADMSGGKGVLFGGVIGALVGMIAGPIGAAIGGAAGAVVGGITAKKIDSGIPGERLTEIGAALQPGSSVILAVVEQKWFEPVQSHLEEAGGNVISETLNEDFFKQVEEGHEDS
jgi:uncharacterized membrane protein